jgi:hypothetical protein
VTDFYDLLGWLGRLVFGRRSGRLQIIHSSDDAVLSVLLTGRVALERELPSSACTGELSTTVLTSEQSWPYSEASAE